MTTRHLFLMALIVSAGAHARAVVYQDSRGFRIAEFDGKEAMALYAALDVERDDRKPGFAKAWPEEKGEPITKLQCNRSGVRNFSCSVEIFDTNSKDPLIFRTGELLTSVLNEDRSESLYKALLIEEKPGRTGNTKRWVSPGGLASVQCTETTTDVTRYSCTVRIHRERFL